MRLCSAMLHIFPSIIFSSYCFLQKPDLVIFVIDSTIGQAAFDQVQAFQQGVALGAVILTKMDGHPKGGGALIAVAIMEMVQTCMILKYLTLNHL